MDGRFTDEELAIAKSVDLCAVAESLGYTVKRIGKYHTLKEMDSIRIYNRSHWYRWSRQFDKGNNGGSQIDFLRVFCGMSVKAVSYTHLIKQPFQLIKVSDNGDDTEAGLLAGAEFTACLLYTSWNAAPESFFFS